MEGISGIAVILNLEVRAQEGTGSARPYWQTIWAAQHEVAVRLEWSERDAAAGSRSTWTSVPVVVYQIYRLLADGGSDDLRLRKNVPMSSTGPVEW